MGFLNSGNDSRDKDIFLASLGFFTFQHCYLTHCLIGFESDLLDREDADTTLVASMMKEASTISEAAKKQFQHLLSNSNLSKEDREFFTDLSNTYDLLNLQAITAIDAINNGGEHLNIFTQAREKAWERISYYNELGKKIQEGI